MGEEFWGRVDTCVSMAESHCCASETITTLLVGYIPVQNKKFFKKIALFSWLMSLLNEIKPFVKIKKDTKREKST